MTRLNTIALATTLIAMALPSLPVSAQNPPIPLQSVKQTIDLTKANWIAFRDFNGRQLLYFTHLMTWKCGLKEIRYAVNSSHIDSSWPLPECNPQNPYFIDPTKDDVYASFPLNSVEFVSVQVVFSDDSETEVMTYVPCDGADGATCAQLLQ